MNFTLQYLKMLLFYLFCSFFFDLANSSCIDPVSYGKGTKRFLGELFQKYGKKSNGISMLPTEFSDLMIKLKIGDIRTHCQDDDTECLQRKHSESRKRRSIQDAYNTSQHKLHWDAHLNNCLKRDKLLSLHAINKSSIDFDDFLALCPSLIQQIDSQQCVHYHTKEVINIEDDTPERNKVWLYGLISITVISLLSLLVIVMIPCLKKTYYHKIMAYLVALAVGTLAGDAMLHLIPHAFAEGANAAAQMKVTQEQQLKQHYSQVWRALFVLLGIYLFFLVEQIMKAEICCKGGHGHSHGGGHSVPNDEGDIPSSPAPEEDKVIVGFNSQDEKVALQPNGDSNSVKSCESNLHEHVEGGHYHADDRHHHHHHGEKNITKDTKIASLAWMVIVGDGFHNFSDGLAVGAAYSASLSSGLSTTIAVFCHELPHELGDFAILIQSGMTIKQAIIYNLISTFLAYLGLIVGILIGGYEMGRHFILSITAGLFLYVSLADMLPELTSQKVPKQSRCSAFFCQHLGILSGIAIMLFISLFEHVI